MAPIGQIQWDSGFSKVLEFGYPFDFAVASSEDRAGSERVQFMNGDETAWIVGTDFILQGQARWIPTESGSLATTGVPISAIQGTDGWRAFLEWARDANEFRWIRDRDDAGTFILSRLVEAGTPTLEAADGTKNIALRIRNTATEFVGY
ncbi:hypothetical protein LCGC14_0718170 [marine sediment metagenome]|uniref:Uncharacterized protein n=1 Tax=marine sediment metagenome TaxID=412755 RepID=A0A0F9QD84_9ZZZZ